MKNILVVGGLGYVGSKLVLALKEKGYSVEVYDLPQNILNVKELELAVNGKDAVYFLAALAVLTYTDENPQETFEVNVIGTNNIARICAEQNVLLHFISTSCSYGEPLETPSIEDSVVNPTDTYAFSKIAGESVVKMWGVSKGLRFNILRMGTIYGQSINPLQRGDMAIQKFLDAAVKKEKIRIDWDGFQSRNFIHLEDLVRGLVLITEKEIEGETINLTGNESISINDIANYALKFGATGTFTASKRKGDFRDQDVSIEKAKRLLGWEPEISFEDGITSFYKWIKENQND